MMSTITSRTTDDGVRIYSRLLLQCYDILIYRLLAPYVWRCKSRYFADLYHLMMSRNHADIGVGTGYFLDRCHYQPGEVRIGLFDLQQNCLNFTAARIARFQPETYLCNALEPMPTSAARFDSIALGGILHCIPGDMLEKGAVFDAIRPLMHAGTQVFGYTILNQDITKTMLSRCVYAVLHRLKVINGDQDSAGQLKSALEKRFQNVEVSTVGCIALFSASTPFK
ncbi:class I SAM-dependent methyltransferase [Undibacterium sp. Tian12W]|uniref:class I SAM-dependent methyltransferase n=1 Tax=Undibacterium sp. Tian12W TaxID=3413054 RepID=UPI003BF3E949